MLKIANKNAIFRDSLREYKTVLEFIYKFKVFGHKSLPYVECFKLDKSKNRYHGLTFATSFS